MPDRSSYTSLDLAISEMDSESWNPSSWRSKKIAQAVEYSDQDHLDKVRTKLKALPPLVTPSEIERLRSQLASVQLGQAFLLHAGDCAESFDACTHENISNKIGLILSFSLILIWGARLPVVRIGRIAGQFAKPRSSKTEKLADGREVFSFRGDNVNGLSPEDRTPDPQRMLSAYFYSTTTLNYIRGLLTSGFASLNHPRDWSLAHVRSPALREDFERITEGLADALDFSRTIGAGEGIAFEQGGPKGVHGEVDFYTSHEGLMLDYEEALTRLFPLPPALRSPASFNGTPVVPGTPLRNRQTDPLTTASRSSSRRPVQNTSSTPLLAEALDNVWGQYNTSAHFLWIGDRTRQLDGAHVEYFRGIRNPIGVKVGPSMEAEELIRLIQVLNPDREPGRLTLITRYGAEKIGKFLPSHIKAVQESGVPVIWICDPMHGNTLTSTSGLKTRNFNTIVSEVTSCLRIHTECGSVLNGVSLEFTGEMSDDGFSVTECLGGSMELTEEQLGLRYQSFCDPRLNFEQSLDLAFLLSNHYKKERKGIQKREKPVTMEGAFADRR